MCGIVGAISHTSVNQDLYDALTIIQHRGQDAAGIMTSYQNRVFLRKSNGSVRDAIRKRHMLRLRGNLGLGHVRYPTAGSESATESQPFYVNSPYGLSLVHNGNLVNAEKLTDELHKSDLRHLNTTSDSEVLLNVFAFELQRVAGKTLTTDALFKAVSAVCGRLVGAYSVIIMINGYGLLAFRDPNGIRPLVYGKRETEKGADYMIVSESIALDVLGYERVADVGAGEAIFIDLNHQCHRFQCVPDMQHTPCIFEYIYLARPDSVMGNIPIYQARLAMGEKLADKILQEHPDHDIDVVIPIPDTSRTAAISVAEKLGVTYCEGFVKNRYIGRTFIMPEQALRRSTVRMKLNPIKEEFQGKNVLLIDDSIVRGTTSKEIVQMARNAGANKVYFASAAPKVCYPNVYGIDMPTAKELIAHNRSVDEVSKLIGSDWLLYQDLEDVCEAINSAAKLDDDKVQRFEDSIFTGNYITGGVDDLYLKRLEELRSDDAKSQNRLVNGDDLCSNVEEP